MSLLDPARSVVRRVRRLRLGSRRRLEQFYSTGFDPFDIDRNPYEHAKFDDLLGAMGDRTYGRGLEVGCSIGSLTERLADRCEQLLAIDIAQQAVDRTRARLTGRDNVTIERRTIPQQLPAGPFDLIVCSDVLYYLPQRRLQHTLDLLAGSLAPGGAIVSLHWLGEHGAPVSGDEVHDLQAATWTGFAHVVSERRIGVGPHSAGYRLDRFDRPVV